MKDGSPLAPIQVVRPPDGADECSAAMLAANPTREESCLQSSHRSRALLLRPLAVAVLEKGRSSGAQKKYCVSISTDSFAAVAATKQGT